MKIHELISLAEYVSKIMAYYPNKSVEYALSDVLSMLNKRSNEISSNKKLKKTFLSHRNDNTKKYFSKSSLHSNPHDESATLSSKPDESLNDLPLVELKRMASEIGIKTSSRQTKAMLVMNISKTIERRGIDSTIQDKDKDKDKDKES